MLLALPGVLAAALLALACISVAALYIWKTIDNIRFAREFFEDKVEIVRIVASKRWHDYSDNYIACTYAAVEFSEATADKLRAHGPKALIGKGWLPNGRERWNPPWRQTPPDSMDERRNVPFECLKFFPKREAALISESLLRPGSWYYENGEVGMFLSVEHRLAVRLRYGD
jgi:hypothetical protein